MKRDGSHKVPSWRGHDPTDFALGVAGDGMDDFGSAHGRG